MATGATNRQRRFQDWLSLSDPYETNRDFYYPMPYEHPIHSRRGDKEVTVDARNAHVDLADIPFVVTLTAFRLIFRPNCADGN
ncbi:MAG: hypothetical protein ACUVQI_01170 [Thermochromatium sp.]